MEPVVEHAPVIVVWSPDDWIKIITAIFSGIAALITAVGATISAINYRRAKRVEVVQHETSRAVSNIEKQTNGMTSELIAKAQSIARAEGYAQALKDKGHT